MILEKLAEDIGKEFSQINPNNYEIISLNGENKDFLSDLKEQLEIYLAKKEKDIAVEINLSGKNRGKIYPVNTDYFLKFSIHR